MWSALQPGLRGARGQPICVLKKMSPICHHFSLICSFCLVLYIKEKKIEKRKRTRYFWTLRDPFRILHSAEQRILKLSLKWNAAQACQSVRAVVMVDRAGEDASAGASPSAQWCHQFDLSKSSDPAVLPQSVLVRPPGNILRVFAHSLSPSPLLLTVLLRPLVFVL